MHAKAHGGYNLDRASRRLKDLDHFVLWSSMVAGAGNEGESLGSAAHADCICCLGIESLQGQALLAVGLLHEAALECC